MTIKTRNIADGAVTTAKIADLAVTNAKLAAGTLTVAKITAIAASFGIGVIQLPLTDFRVLTTNEFTAIAGTPADGIAAKNSDPIFERVNAATDKALRLHWAATSVVEVATHFVTPPDLDDAANVEVHILAAMEAANDTPVIAVSYFENGAGVYAGDSNAGGNTAAVTGTTVTEYSVAVAAANVAASPTAVQVGFVPAAHGTDALYLYGAWIEYTRK